MDFNEEKFQEHLKEIVAAGQVDGDRPLTLSELRELANSMGLSDEEWEKLLESANQNLILAQNHIDARNYVDAVAAADKATAINPYIKNGNSILAKAYLMQWLDDKDPVKAEKAEFYARKELIVDPEDKFALDVLSTVQNKKRISANDNKVRKYVFIGIGAVALIILIFMFSGPSGSDQIKDQLIELEEEVNAKLELVNTANDRRNNLIPQLLGSISSNSSINSEIKDLQNEINAADDDEKIELELALEKKISEVKNLMGEGQAKTSLIIEIEGAENRISFARNAYNEAVKHYNILVKKNQDEFPEFELKPYYK